MPLYSPLPSVDTTGALSDGQRVLGNGNRPRSILPSFNAWTRVAAGVVKNVAATWEANWAGYGIDVLWCVEKQKLAMLYGGHDGTLAKIGLAYSDDGITWTKYGSNPVFSVNGSGGQPDTGGVVYFQVTYEAGTYYAYYIGFPTTGVEQGTPSILLATATALEGPWTRHTTGGAQKITTASFPGGSSVAVMYRPNVLKVGSTYYMFINAGTAPGTEDIWCFTAPTITGPWTVVGTTPVLAASAVTGSTGILSDPEVIRSGDMFVMMFWSGNGVQWAYSRADEFPGTWHASTGVLTATGALYRTNLVTLPTGELVLYVNGNSEAQVDVYVPQSTTSLGSRPQVVSALPSNPYEGQEIRYLADSTKGVVWDLKYRAKNLDGTANASSYKWEFMGGSEMWDEVDTNEGVSGAGANTYQALATAGPTVTTPLAGDYEVSHGAYVFDNSATAAVSAIMSYSVGGTAAADADCAQMFINSLTQFDGASIARRRTKTAIAASTALASKYRSGTTNQAVSFQYRWMRVKPIRVG